MDPLWSLVVIWIPLLTLLPDTVLTSRYAHFRQQPSLDNLIFEENLLWKTTSASKLGCAERCASDLNCAAFTSTKMTSVHVMTCRGHSQAVTSEGMKSPNTRLYNVDRRSVSVIPDWLGKACTNSKDCTQTNSECFATKCLCTPGYYYSNSKRTCKPECKSLQKTFVLYPDWYISLNNLDEKLTSQDECLKWCVSLEKCVSFEYSEDTGKCYVSAVTPLDVPDRWGKSGASFTVSYWQRTCL